jgi:potassium efflux system protein
MSLRIASVSHAFLGALLLVCSAQGVAQSLIPGIKLRTSDTPAAQLQSASADETLSAQISEVEQRLGKRQSQLAPVQPPVASAAEWNKYQQLQASEARTLSAHLNALRNLAEVRRSAQDAETTRKTWKGFGQQPPYDIALVDDWWAQVRRKTREIEAARVEQRLVDSVFEQAKQVLKTAQQAQRQADEQLQTSNDPAQVPRLRWQAELARLNLRYSESRLGMFETMRVMLLETLANHQVERQWLEENATQASRTVKFSQRELDILLAKLADQSSALAQRIDQAEAADHQSQNELERMRKQANASHSTKSQLLETARIEADAGDGRLNSLRLMNYGLSLMQQAWPQRYRGMQSHGSHTLQQTTAQIDIFRKRIGEWRSAIKADNDRTQANLALLGTQLAEWKPELGDRRLVEQQFRAYQGREALLRQNQNQIEQSEGMLYNWQQVNQVAYQDISWIDRLRGAWDTASYAVKSVWDFELITVDDTIVVEGREIVGKRSVTLGKLVQVLLILVLGLWLTSRISAFARRRLLARYTGEESAALLWLRLSSIGMGVGLVVLALITAHIPLTAFAFMGGALALGLGFGAQNILNNFISGMILLVEKPIKLGDIVEVEGIRGRIHDIGSRCCQVRRYDGIDMLIPNSVFLERTVTNWTLSDQLLRFSVTIGIAYGSPIEAAMQHVREVVTDHLSVLKVPIPLVLLEDFGDNALLLRVDYWLDISLQDNSRQVASEIRLGIEKRFTEHGIAIPFPQRDVHLDSSAPIRVEMVAPA